MSISRMGYHYSSIKHWNFLLQAYQQQQEQLKVALDQLADNEQLIGSLRLQLSSLTGRNQEERQSLDAQFRQMELALMTRNEECEGLVNEIRSVSYHHPVISLNAYLLLGRFNRRLPRWIS